MVSQKKWLAPVFTLALTLGLVACDGKQQGNNDLSEEESYSTEEGFFFTEEDLQAIAESQQEITELCSQVVMKAARYNVWIADHPGQEVPRNSDADIVASLLDCAKFLAHSTNYSYDSAQNQDNKAVYKEKKDDLERFSSFALSKTPYTPFNEAANAEYAAMQAVALNHWKILGENGVTSEKSGQYLLNLSITLSSNGPG